MGELIMKYSPKAMVLTDPRSSSPSWPSGDPLRWANVMKDALVAKLGSAQTAGR